MGALGAAQPLARHPEDALRGSAGPRAGSLLPTDACPGPADQDDQQGRQVGLPRPCGQLRLAHLRPRRAGHSSRGRARQPSLTGPAVAQGPRLPQPATSPLRETKVLEHQLRKLAEPHHTGRVRRLRRVAGVVTLTGGLEVAARLGGGGARTWHRLLDLAGGPLFGRAAVERLAMLEAGQASAPEPRYTVGPQRRRLADRAATAPVAEPWRGGADGSD